ncbi:hypothetical protein PspLS_11004 [Pyricularia sp. CBS 133598]|nr:hypothetical protein PspLS_11004 [Pyricularia sp. CBS 133598]
MALSGMESCPSPLVPRSGVTWCICADSISAGPCSDPLDVPASTLVSSFAGTSAAAAVTAPASGEHTCSSSCFFRSCLTNQSAPATIMATPASTPTTMPAIAPPLSSFWFVTPFLNPKPSGGPVGRRGPLGPVVVASAGSSRALPELTSGVAVAVALMMEPRSNLSEVADGCAELRLLSPSVTLLSGSHPVLQQMLIWFLVSVHFSVPARQHHELPPPPHLLVLPSDLQSVASAQHTLSLFLAPSQQYRRPVVGSLAHAFCGAGQ